MTFLKTCLYKEELHFIIVNIFVILVNKFVLSVLKFTVPTVFQGWQTLVCVITLSFLARWKKLNSELEIFDGKTLISYLFPLLCYTLAIVSGSKALAELSVPVFLAGTNVIQAVLCIHNNQKLSTINTELIGSYIICVSTVIIFFSTWISSPGHGWFWLCIHISTWVLYNISLPSAQDHHSSTITLIYYRNFFSLAVLIPLSIYLEEVIHAFQYHSVLAGSSFYIGCVISGILGTWLQFLQIYQDESDRKPIYLGTSKVICAIFSSYVFIYDLNLISWIFVFVNLMTGTFAFIINRFFNTSDILNKPVTIV